VTVSAPSETATFSMSVFRSRCHSVLEATPKKAWRKCSGSGNRGSWWSASITCREDIQFRSIGSIERLSTCCFLSCLKSSSDSRCTSEPLGTSGSLLPKGSLELIEVRNSKSLPSKQSTVGSKSHKNAHYRASKPRSAYNSFQTKTSTDDPTEKTVTPIWSYGCQNGPLRKILKDFP
jgi:hypothetical protein